MCQHFVKPSKNPKFKNYAFVFKVPDSGLASGVAKLSFAGIDQPFYIVDTDHYAYDVPCSDDQR